MKIPDFVPLEGVLRLSAGTAAPALDEIADRLASIAGLPAATVRTLLHEREQLGCTALGKEIAVPHERADVSKLVGVLATSVTGVDMGASDKKPVRVFVAFLSPRAGGLHLKALAAVVQKLADDGVRARVLAAKTPAEALEAVA